MLNLSVAMLQVISILILLFVQPENPLTITSPVSGANLQGVVPVNGNTALTGFLSAELSFAYANDPTGTWFLIDSSSAPVTDGQLAAWETNSLTDGDYTLRLRVYLSDGAYQEITVPDLHVRNYTVIATTTQRATLPAEPTPLPPSPTAVPATAFLNFSAPTSLPANPVAVAEPSIYFFLGGGALFTLIVSAVVGLILRRRRS
jgi:hypothetical protein